MRAISPVIATVILIAVAVALGIAVAFWAKGLTDGLQKQNDSSFNGTVSSIFRSYDGSSWHTEINIQVSNGTIVSFVLPDGLSYQPKAGDFIQVTQTTGFGGPAINYTVVP